MSTTYCWKMQGEERRREGLHVDSAGAAWEWSAGLTNA